ncbi:hypothetical protein [Streptomyces sp. KL110A]|uniref:hypothetical protein n=1 Tax=Streptomyces sp. KL110A TaxID=3384221 RepID=UPI0038BFE05F
MTLPGPLGTPNRPTVAAVAAAAVLAAVLAVALLGTGLAARAPVNCAYPRPAPPPC